jgi:hypothetical protein
LTGMSFITRSTHNSVNSANSKKVSLADKRKSIH